MFSQIQIMHFDDTKLDRQKSQCITKNGDF